jgi:hypothetical protein
MKTAYWNYRRIICSCLCSRVRGDPAIGMARPSRTYEAVIPTARIE